MARAILRNSRVSIVTSLNCITIPHQQPSPISPITFSYFTNRLPLLHQLPSAALTALPYMPHLALHYFLFYSSVTNYVTCLLSYILHSCCLRSCTLSYCMPYLLLFYLISAFKSIRIYVVPLGPCRLLQTLAKQKRVVLSRNGN